MPYKCWNHLLSLHSHDITCKPAQSCKRILWFVTACNKTHSLCLSLTLPNDHLCQDLSGHCVLCCAVPRQPWPALFSFLYLDLAPQEPHARKGHLWKSGHSHFWWPVCYFTVLFQPKTTSSVGQHSLSRSLFPKCWIEESTDMGSHHTGLCRTAYSSVSTHVIWPV